MQPKLNNSHLFSRLTGFNASWLRPDRGRASCNGPMTPTDPIIIITTDNAFFPLPVKVVYWGLEFFLCDVYRL